MAKKKLKTAKRSYRRMIAFTPGGVQVPISVRSGIGGKQLIAKLRSRGLMTSTEYLMSNLIRRAMLERGAGADPVDTPPKPEQEQPGWFRRNWRKIAGIGGAALLGGLGTAAFKKWGIPALTDLNQKYDLTGRVASKIDALKERIAIMRAGGYQPIAMASDDVLIDLWKLYDNPLRIDGDL